MHSRLALTVLAALSFAAGCGVGPTAERDDLAGTNRGPAKRRQPRRRSPPPPCRWPRGSSFPGSSRRAVSWRSRRRRAAGSWFSTERAASTDDGARRAPRGRPGARVAAVVRGGGRRGAGSRRCGRTASRASGRGASSSGGARPATAAGWSVRESPYPSGAAHHHRPTSIAHGSPNQSKSSPHGHPASGIASPRQGFSSTGADRATPGSKQ